MWNEIFDGGIDDRIEMVFRVSLDSVCMSLTGGAIRPALAERCIARELFKYAAYVDACITTSFVMLHGSRFSGGVSLYESVYASLSGNLVDAASGGRVEVGRNGRKLREMSILATWLADKCSPMQFIPLDGDLRATQVLGAMNSHGDLVAAVKPGRDAALAIAARAGEPWAVQAFYVEGLAADIDYWMSLHDFKPLLFHRWMATEVGAEMGLGPWDRALHALKAFTVDRRTAPDLGLDGYLARYGLSREWIDPSWRDLSALSDGASALDQRLVYPWDATR